MSSPIITEANYLEFGDIIKEFIRNNELKEAEDYLLRIIDLIERITIKKGIGISPGFYLELAKLYKKQGSKEKEINILHRFLVQPKAGGEQSKKILERYAKLIDSTDMESLKESFYNEYLEKIRLTKLLTKYIECPNCQKKILMIIPSKKVQLFRGSCPRCYENNLFIVE